jgi:hypothetical protein
MDAALMKMRHNKRLNMLKGVSICRLAPEDMQNMSTFPVKFVGLEPS